MPILLAIESSCDDTGAAVLDGNKVLSNVIANQTVHEQYGGVVPELASRAHQKNIIPTVDSAMKEAGITMDDLDGIAVTRGPGLLGSLLVGTSFAKSLSLSRGLPLIGVDHMKAHIMAHFIEDGSPVPEFPFLCLTVSGGHTQIVKINAVDDLEILGKTLDDAAGEAFDKSAKLMGLPYPGGPFIDKYAQMGDPNKYKFPISNIPDFDYSFSGVKTAFMYFLKNGIKKDEEFIEQNRNDICASIQKTIVDTLLQKFELAMKSHPVKHIALAGGVSANSELRKRFGELAETHDISAHIPNFEYCTDNAAMIGIAGQFLLQAGVEDGMGLVPSARLPF